MADVEVAAEHERPCRARPPRARRPRHAAASRTGPPPCRFATHTPARSSRTAWTHRRSGQMASAVASGDSTTKSPRTRIALQPPPFDLITSGQRTAIARRSGQQRVPGGEHQPLIGLESLGQRRRPPRRHLLEQRHVPLPPAPARRRTRRTDPAPTAAPSARAAGSRSIRAAPSGATYTRALAAPFHHRDRAERRGAARADRARARAQGGALQLRRAAQAHGGADLPEALHAHPCVVRDRHRRAGRPPDGAAHRRAPALPRRVGPRHRLRALAPRGGDRDPHRRRGPGQRDGRARGACR